jgi:hypothetical protein
MTGIALIEGFGRIGQMLKFFLFFRQFLARNGK